ncbi:MAG: pantetheine-phosphate adenylyltransferase [Salibacteraceae bacterium]
MERIAVFPGSFDPITKGHEAVVKRAIPLFDKVVVAIGVNSTKSGFFPLEQRLTFLKQTFEGLPTVEVTQYSGLTINYCKGIGAQFLLRGLRNTADFNYEFTIASMNRQVGAVETVFLMTDPEFLAINSTVVRDIIRNGGDATPFLPNALQLP